MANSFLDRATLAKFLPTQEAIKAFENLFTYVVENPSTLDEIVASLNSLKHNNNNQIGLRIEEIEQKLARQQNLSSILQRLDEIEQRTGKQQNLSGILQRLEALEQVVSQRANLTDINSRIKKIEEFVGV